LVIKTLDPDSIEMLDPDSTAVDHNNKLLIQKIFRNNDVSLWALGGTSRLLLKATQILQRLFSSGISHLFTRIHPLLPLLPTAGLYSSKLILISHLLTGIHPLLPLLPTAAGLHSGKLILILILVIILDNERLELPASILLFIILVLVILVLVVVLEENKPLIKGSLTRDFRLFS
jgi:hypothetical protein